MLLLLLKQSNIIQSKKSKRLLKYESGQRVSDSDSAACNVASGHVFAFNVAQIAASKHSEKTILAPSWVPTVGNQPILEGSSLSLWTCRWWVRCITRAHFCWTIVRVCQQAICEAPTVRHSRIDCMAYVMRIAICALTPTNDLHSMSTHEGSGIRARVNTTPVEFPILVDVETSGDGPIGHDLGLHLCYTTDRVSRRCKVFVCCVRKRVTGLASLRSSR